MTRRLQTELVLGASPRRPGPRAVSIAGRSPRWWSFVGDRRRAAFAEHRPTAWRAGLGAIERREGAAGVGAVREPG